MKRTAFLLAAILCFGLLAAALAAPEAQVPPWQDLKAPGKKNWIGDAVYFIYTPNEKPKMGTIILKVRVFTKSGEKDKSFIVKGQFDMPSMAGAHDSGLQTFALNKAGNYLLPVNIVMPGEWELRLTFIKAGKTVFRGRTKFNV
jgi:hypothetical protein